MSNTKDAVAAGRKLRIDIADYLLEHGPQSNDALAAGIGQDCDVVRRGLMRMIKAGRVRSDRRNGRRGRGVIAMYQLVDDETASTATRSVSLPFRPVLKVWDPLQVRDPFALPANFFGARAA